MTQIALKGIHIYQKMISPYLGYRCRYEPTCSHYSYEAIGKYGLIKGIWLTLRRLIRCRPSGGNGYDPVP